METLSKHEPEEKEFAAKLQLDGLKLLILTNDWSLYAGQDMKVLTIKTSGLGLKSQCSTFRSSVSAGVHRAVC